MAPQVGGIDLTAHESGGLEPLQVERHRRLGHAQRRRQLRRVGMLVDLREEEQLLGLEPQRGDVGLDAGDHRHQHTVVQRPDLRRIVSGIDIATRYGSVVKLV